MPARKRPRKSKREYDLHELVGDDVYSVWLKMLKTLVPDGRTHRLAPLVAAMLQYAAAQTVDREAELEGNITAQILIEADADGYSEEIAKDLARLVEQLFDDAGVQYARRSRAGDDYSISEEAANEYIAWYNMPWE